MKTRKTSVHSKDANIRQNLEPVTGRPVFEKKLENKYTVYKIEMDSWKAKANQLMYNCNK